MSFLKRIFGKRDESYTQAMRNEEILEIVCNEMSLIHTEGKYCPHTWTRPANLTGEGENALVITDFDGISLSYDEANDVYKLSIPVKYNNAFTMALFELLNELYDNVVLNDQGFTKVIKFTISENSHTSENS